MPRGLRRAQAAAYVGVSPSHFDNQRKAGAVPAPKLVLGVEVWDRLDLDRLFAALPAHAGNDNNPWDSALAA